MTSIQARILAITNGAPAGQPALEYGLWLAQQLDTGILALGVVERPSRLKPVESLMADIGARAREAGVQAETVVTSGPSEVVIPQWANSGNFIAILGPLERPRLLRWLRGRSFRRQQERILSPLIYVRQTHFKLEHILVCLGGLGYSLSALLTAARLAQRLSARLTLMHVVEPVLYSYPSAEQIREHWEQVFDSDTPIGENLRSAVRLATELVPDVAQMVRQGDVVHAILEEVQTRSYDLLAMGSHSDSRGLRNLARPDVTAEVAEAVEIPVLAVHLDHDLSFE